MEKSKLYERHEISSWSSCDVNELYENIAKVGSGTYGEVNKARVKANPSQIVALKKIKDASETEGFPITALREISLLQQCDHPNIIKLLNVGTSKAKSPTVKDNKSYTYLVFEYMDHELLGYIEMCQLNQSQVKCIIKQVLEGLAYLHSKDIIHRDIKSANILVNNRGEVKIADFGLSKAVNPNLSGKLTQRVVTRWYRSPELLLGTKKYSNKIDIWALGCVFAELLIGKSQALFPAQKTPDQFELICEKCGTPDEGQWPEYKNMPFYSKMAPRKNYTRVLTQYMCRQRADMDPFALDLLEKMLCFNPEDRISALEALHHPYFQSYPPACAPYELPKIDQECHTFIINTKRKNNYAENNYKNNPQYINQKMTYKNRVMQPQQQRNNVHNVHPVPMNAQPPLCQYNSYCNCNQYTHIENVNNINVNLFLPAQNHMMPQMSQMSQMTAPIPQISQVNFYPPNYSQQIPYFNSQVGFQGTNNNLYVPSNPMELGFVLKPANMIPLTNNNSLPNINSYPSFCNPNPQQQQQQQPQVQPQTQRQHLQQHLLQQQQQQPTNTYSNPVYKYPYQQEPSLYNITNTRKEQVQNIGKPNFPIQDIPQAINAQNLKRRATNNIEEFEVWNAKKQFLELLLPNN